ncbi:MAG: penicillin-binding protein 1A [Desulfosarcinaceae bacterium]|nr:penicillin-binding protein 1A [Desulfosarcinaceae bacterium]
MRKTAIVLILMAAVLCGTTVGAFIGLTRDLPQIRALGDFQPAMVSRLYDIEGELIAEFYAEKREPVPLTAIPPLLVTALLTTEDRKFYDHSGVDIRGILRAIIKDIQARRFAEGASTLTQQLAKTLFLTPRKTLVRKLKEAILAIQLERRYTKAELLTLYLNQVYFGSGAYGVAAAAETFFGKSLEALSLAECALIAGMPKAPSRYSPLVNPELARKRRDVVLQQMLATAAISPEAHLKATAEDLRLRKRQNGRRKAPYFVDQVRNELETLVGTALLYKGGLTIYTTLSWRLQQAAEAAVEKGLDALATRMLARGQQDLTPQGALVALDVASGGIRAMVGGRHYPGSSFNRVLAAQRQPGSAFKPLVFAYALEHGFSQADILLDAPVAYGRGEGQAEWRPENFNKGYQGEMSLRYALAESANIPAVRLMEAVGPASVVSFAHRLGISAQLNANLALALGASEVNLLELTAAYAVFPNRGEAVTPYTILEIQDNRGATLYRAHPQRRVVMSRAGAAIMTDMLQAVIQEGTGRPVAYLGARLAGKTGTTSAYRDALFLGFSPHIAAGVWVGVDDFSSMGSGETGSRAALPIWADFMEAHLAAAPLAYFDRPADVVKRHIDPFSGQHRDPLSRSAVAALFRKQ